MPHHRSSSGVATRRNCLALLRRWREGDGYAADLMAESMEAVVPRDRALTQSMLYGVLRNLRLLDAWIDQLREGGSLGAGERDLLRLGLCQLLLLGLAEHAAVDTTVSCAGRARGLVNAILRRAIREREALLAGAADLPLGVRGSHPDWLVERWSEQWDPEIAARLVEWNQCPAPVWLRLNRLRAAGWQDVDVVSDGPAGDGPSLDWLGDLAADFRRVDQLPGRDLAGGRVYAQDPSTAGACELLDPRPGETVIDACAAPGGKTALLWQMMGQRGRLIACDLPGRRSERLRDNLRRLGADGVEVREVDWLRPARAPAPPLADRILLDLPCSNTGVMRRRIDVRWRLQPGEIEELSGLQCAITRAALSRLKPTGVLVYSSCSVDHEENEKNVEALTRNQPGLKCLGMRSTRPWEHGVDGGFAAALSRS